MASGLVRICNVLLVVALIVAILYYMFPFKRELYQINEVHSDINGSPTDDLFSPLTKMNDPKLIQYLRKKIVYPKRFFGIEQGKPLLASWPSNRDWSQVDESYPVDKLLKSRTNGFFVECGASDGETYSNSLFFETARNFTGLLVEANTGMFNTLLKKQRNVYAYHGCLSPNNYPQILLFKESDFLGGIAGEYEPQRKEAMKSVPGREVKVECVPFYSLMLALNITHVDYFSLDTEGSETSILQTIPFDKIKIDAMSVEFLVWKGSEAEEKKKIANIVKIMNDTKLYKSAYKHQIDLFFTRSDVV